MGKCQGAARAMDEPELSRFNLILTPEVWGLSERALAKYQKKYPDHKNPVSAAFVKTWRTDDHTKIAFTNWELYAYGKGKLAEPGTTLASDEFAKLLPIDGAKIKRLMKNGEGSQIVMMRYARVCYDLGVADRAAKIIQVKKGPAAAARLARRAASYAQQEAAVASGKTRLCALDQQVCLAVGCKTCQKINKFK